jgi:hypothetical protein
MQPLLLLLLLLLLQPIGVAAGACAASVSECTGQVRSRSRPAAATRVDAGAVLCKCV